MILSDTLVKVVDNRGKTPPWDTNTDHYELIETASLVGNNKYPDYSRIGKWVSKETFEDWFRSGHPIKDDVLIATVGANIGSVAIMKETRGCVAQNLVAFRTNKEILNPHYLYYYLSWGVTQKNLKNLDIGAAQPSIKVPHILALDIPLHPLPIQHKIADVLSAYDDLIEVNTRRIRILEQMAQSVYREWFGKVDAQSLSERWELVTVRDVTSYINCGVSPEYDDSSASIVINQKCIRDERLNLNLARRHITKVSAEKYIKFGDVLVNSTGIGTLGRVAQVYQNVTDCTVDSHVSIVRPNNRVSIDYFGFYLLKLQPLFDSLGTGSTGQTELARETIGNADFVLPPEDLQNKFTEFVLPLRKQLTALPAKNANLRRTRPAPAAPSQRGGVRPRIGRPSTNGARIHE